MPPVYSKPPSATPASRNDLVMPARPRSRSESPVIAKNKIGRRSKFRLPILQILADMEPGCGMPLSTLAELVADAVHTKQDVKVLAGNLVQMALGYAPGAQHSRDSNRFEPTLMTLGYIGVEEAYVDEGVTEQLYFITPLGRQALASIQGL